MNGRIANAGMQRSGQNPAHRNAGGYAKRLTAGKVQTVLAKQSSAVPTGVTPTAARMVPTGVPPTAARMVPIGMVPDPDRQEHRKTI